MISKQFIRSSLRAVKASTQSSATSALIARVSGFSALRFCPPAHFDAQSTRWLSSSLRADEEQAASPTPVPDHEELFAVYLSNLSFSVSEELLTEFISQYAPVKKVDVVRSADGAARGFGFAKFATQTEAEAAVNAINGLDFLGRPLSAAISIRRPVIATASNQLFMSGFPTDGEADEAALRQALQETLNMQPRVIRFHKFPGGFLKGTGHIEFEDEASVDTALAKLQQLGPDSPVKVAGRALTLVKARPLLQSRTRARGGFDGGRGGYGGPRGFPGAQGGYGPQDGYPGYGAPGGYGAPPPYGGGYNAGYPGAPSSGGYAGPPYGRGGGENTGGHSSPY